MVSLPRISLQEGSKRFSNQSQKSSLGKNTVTFCDGNCTQELVLPISTINPKIVQQYKERCAQLHSIAKLFFREETNNFEEAKSLEERNSKFQIDDVPKKSLQINLPDDFPLIDQSKLIPQKTILDWKTITEKASRNPQRCNVLRPKPQQRKLHQKQRIRDLPALISSGDLTKLPSICPDTKHTPKLLDADPHIVVFDGFEVGGLYKKHCKITNVSPGKCAFTLAPLRADSHFRVECDRGVALAAGMSTQLTVLFQYCFLVDVHEKLVLLVQNKPELTIHLVALCPPSPHLIEIINKDFNIKTKMGGKINSLIDCGSHFVGELVKITVNLKNIGPKARFCFVREIDWYSMEFVIDSSNSLVLGSFTIEPMLFALNKGQTIEISISFNAPSLGFHTEQMYLMCDNCSVNCVDLEGDGYWFDPAWIQFIGLWKLFDVDIDDDQSVDYFINFGSALRFFELSFSFLLFHNGHVNLSYHWEVRPTVIRGTRPLPDGALSVSPACGRLYAYNMESFWLQCDTSFLHPGRYRMLLVLIVDDLPKKCVPRHLHERLRHSRENDEDELQSIEANSIEVWVECVRPDVTLVPFVIDCSESPLVCGSLKETRDVTVRNGSPNPVFLSWHCETDSPLVRLNIQPQQLTCLAFSSTICTVSIEALHEGPFTAVFKCISDNGDFGLELQIKGNCCKKQLRMITDLVDLGSVRKGSQQSAQIIAESCSAEKTLWTLNELIFNPRENGHLEPSENLESLSAHEGEFCHKESQVFIKYQLDTQRDQLWCSVLDWGGQYVPVMADVQQADVSLSTHLLLADQLYLGVKCHCRITVRNHTVSSTPVFWGNPTVEPHGSVTVDVTPRFTVLEPCQELSTDINFTPHSKGPLTNFYIPCFVEGLLQPLLLKVEGVVEGLMVRVEWESENQHCCVVWPTDEHSESKDNFKHSISLDSVICSCPPNSPYLESVESECEESPELSQTSIKEAGSDEDEMVCTYVSDETNDDVSEISSIPYLNWPIIGGRYTRDPMCESMERHFRDLFILEELSHDENSNVYPEDHNVLNFRDIPVREAVTQVVYIRNDTMIATCYEAWVVNNFERLQQPETTSVLERMERRVKSNVNKDEWCRRVSKDRGLTVFVEPSRGELPAQDYVCLRVTVYALSWGCYSDALLLQLGDLDQLCLRLSVTVTQHPVSVQQLIRFGAMSFKSPQQCRYLKVENTSTVPVRICWQMFKPPADASPFNVMLFDASPFELHLTESYGSFTSSLFQVDEKYTVLGPFSSTNVQVKFYAENSNINALYEQLSEITKAILVGHVYLTDEARYITNNESCVRVDGWKLQSLKVDLEVCVELPTLSLLNVFNYQLIFKCTSYDVMSTQKKVWQEEKVLTVQNKCCSDLKAMVSTVGYFYISKITYPCDQENKYSSKDEIFLRPGETCEVTVGCKVTEEALYDLFEEEPVASPQPDIEAGTVEYEFLLFAQKDLEQEVKLKLYIYQPLLRLSETSLDFDLVYIGDTKGLIVIITAPIGKEYFEASIKSGGDGVFTVHDDLGTLQPGIGFPLEISFSPQKCITYSDILVIRTCLDRIFWEIPLYGNGTFNYKSHLY